MGVADKLSIIGDGSYGRKTWLDSLPIWALQKRSRKVAQCATVKLHHDSITHDIYIAKGRLHVNLLGSGGGHATLLAFVIFLVFALSRLLQVPASMISRAHNVG